MEIREADRRKTPPVLSWHFALFLQMHMYTVIGNDKHTSFKMYSLTSDINFSSNCSLFNPP